MRQTTLFPFTYTYDAEEIRHQLAQFDAKLTSLRAELHQRMKWRARYHYGVGVLTQLRRSIVMYDGWSRNGRAKLRMVEAAAQSSNWRAAA